MADDPLLVTRSVAQVFDGLNIPYFVGGSMASSYHGVWRSTQGIDSVADAREEHVLPLSEALTARNFLTDVDLIRDGVARQDTFNVLDLTTFYKVDVFILNQTAWAREELARRRLARLNSGDEPIAFYVASPEDIVLQKLRWYRLTGNSERQWLDVQKVLQVKADTLDYEYLRRWAAELDLTDLLDEALADAKLEP